MLGAFGVQPAASADAQWPQGQGPKSASAAIFRTSVHSYLGVLDNKTPESCFNRGVAFRLAPARALGLGNALMLTDMHASDRWASEPARWQGERKNAKESPGHACYPKLGLQKERREAQEASTLRLRRKQRGAAVCASASPGHQWARRSYVRSHARNIARRKGVNAHCRGSNRSAGAEAPRAGSQLPTVTPRREGEGSEGRTDIARRTVMF